MAESRNEELKGNVEVLIRIKNCRALMSFFLLLNVPTFFIVAKKNARAWNRTCSLMETKGVCVCMLFDIGELNIASALLGKRAAFARFRARFWQKPKAESRKPNWVASLIQLYRG